MKIIATGLPASVEDYQLALNAAFAGGAAYGTAKEREECAKLAQQTICDTHTPTGVNIYGTRVAKLIRARG
jgi:hypothetical protein